MSFNQGAPGVPTVLNTSNCFIYSNSASGNALSVQQLGAGNVFSFSNVSGQVMVMNNLGRVGVGTTSPGYPLDVQDTTTGNLGNFQTSVSGGGNLRLQCTNVSNSGLGFIGVNAFVNSVFGLGSSSATPVVFYQGGNEYMRVHTNGLVGIGTADPKGPIHSYTTRAGFPDSSGSGTSNVVARIQSGSICLDFGSIGGTNPFWIQNHLDTAWNTTYPLLLNPNGGSVGIGTTSPSTAFTVNTGSPAHGIRHTDGTITVETYIGGGAGWLGTFSNHPLYFFTNNQNQGMVLSTDNKVGIGLTNPSATLDVSGLFRVNGATGSPYAQQGQSAGYNWFNGPYNFLNLGAGRTDGVVAVYLLTTSVWYYSTASVTLVYYYNTTMNFVSLNNGNGDNFTQSGTYIQNRNNYNSGASTYGINYSLLRLM